MDGQALGSQHRKSVFSMVGLVSPVSFKALGVSLGKLQSLFHDWTPHVWPGPDMPGWGTWSVGEGFCPAQFPQLLNSKEITQSSTLIIN